MLELNSIKKQLESEVTFVDFCHVCTLFLNTNNKNLAGLKVSKTKNLVI